MQTFFFTVLGGEAQLTPKFQVALLHGNAQIVCEGDKWVTFFKGRHKVSSKIIKENILQLKKLTFQDQGEYSCLGEKDGHSFNLSSRLFVTGETCQQNLLAI